MELVMWIEKDQTLYVNSDALVPPGLNYKQHSQYLRDNPTTEGKIKKSRFRKEIEAAIAEHPGCHISEFCTPYGCPI